MYINIDYKNKVVAQIVDKFAQNLIVDNKTTFKTSNPPVTGKNEVLYFNPTTFSFYTEKVVVTEEQKARMEERKVKNVKKQEALKWLSDNDWKVNKRLLGEWSETDDRWLQYLAERAKMRAQYDEAIK